jgi:hypothetical protein
MVQGNVIVAELVKIVVEIVDCMIVLQSAIFNA